MTEFEIQELLIASRWEFDVATYFFILVSTVFLAVALSRPGGLDKTAIRLLQLAYVVITAYLYIRTYAAIIRGQKLGGLLVQMDPVFEFWNPSLQQPTWYLRVATFILLTATTVFLLHRAAEKT